MSASDSFDRSDHRLGKDDMHEDPSILVFGVQLAGLTVGALAALTFFLQRHLSPVYGMSSLMFLAFVVSQLSAVSEMMSPGYGEPWRHFVHAISYASSFFIAPAFLFQVLLLTQPNRSISRGQVMRHLALPLLVLPFVTAFLLAPFEMREIVYAGGDLSDTSVSLFVASLALFLFVPIVHFQWFFYACLVFFIQHRHRARLKKVFASTENYEVFWVAVIAAVLGLFALMSLVSFVLELQGSKDFLPPIISSSLVLLFIVLLTVHGLRQAPGLQAARHEMRVANEECAKYSKSALDQSHAQRIATKLHRVMSEEKVYRDPNLSLSKLAHRIGSSPNYLSQTLNEHMGKSFFDYVNAWRIDEAQEHLTGSRMNILSITYETGFNSRSAFYSAFKKHTGMTPTQFRKQENTDPLDTGTKAIASL